MHCVEKYSRDCNIPLHTPHVELAFFPQPEDKYIIIENSYRAEYSHIDEMIAYLNPFLNKEGVWAMQLKLDPKDKSIQKCRRVYENLQFPQINYLIKNSLLVVSNDHYIPTIAGILNSPAISLHGNFPPKSNSPFWGAENCLCLESESKNYPLAVGTEENTIDQIFPETIARKVLEKIGIKSNLSQIVPVYCGNQFASKTIEVIPDFSPENSIRGENINIRGDYYFDEQNIVKLISQNRSNLITKKLISAEYLSVPIIKENLIQINYEVSLSSTQEEVDKLTELGCETHLFCRNEEDISQVRINLIDYIVNLEKPKEKKELDFLGKICDNTCYKSSKILISKEKHYSSKAKWINQEPLQKTQFEKIVDSPEFWEEADHFKLFNINVPEKKDS